MATNPKTIDYITKLSKSGYQLIKDHRYQAAEQNFLEMLRIDKHNHYALVGLADSLRRQNKNEEAVTYYRECLTLYPKNNYALFGIAESYRSLQHYHKAIETWEQYAQLDGKNIIVMTRMADIYRKVRNLKRAQEIYEDVLEKETHNVYATIGLAHVYYDLSLYDRAIQYWNHALSIPGIRIDIRVLTSVGNCYRKLHKYTTALDYYQKGETLDSQNFYILYGIADTYRGLQDFSNAMEYWKKLIQAGHSSHFVLSRAGDTAYHSGSYQIARSFYERALNEAPNHLPAALGLAQLAYKEKKFDESVQILEKLQSSHYQNPRVQLNLALALCAVNQSKKAYLILDDFLKTGYGDEAILSTYQSLKEGLKNHND